MKKKQAQDDKIVIIGSLVIDFIKPEDIVRIYSGRPGCACGCRGVYREGLKGKRILNNMKIFCKGHTLQILKGLDKEWLISCECQDTIYTLYIATEVFKRVLNKCGYPSKYVGTKLSRVRKGELVVI